MLEAIWNFICFHPEVTVLGAITLIQVAPIKIDPWSGLAKVIKKWLVGGIEEKINEINKKVDSLERNASEEKAVQARTHILRFADELYEGKHHSKEYFDDMLDDIDMYEKYCKKHADFANNKTVMSIKRIKDIYAQLMESHEFNH